jgi:hypothetical protein
MAQQEAGYRNVMPTWSVAESRVPTDGARAELICTTVARVAAQGGGLEEALQQLIPLALGRWDLVELALDNTTRYLRAHPDDTVWRRTAHLLERSLTTGIFHS